MSESSESGLVYHVERKRRLRGFLPLYVLLAVLPVAAVLWLVPVRMPEDLPEPRTGRVYYRDGRLMYFQLMQRSPQPFRLPEGVDPVGESAARLVVPLRRVSDYVAMTPADLYEAAGDSCVLDKSSLLALPPESEVEESEDGAACASSPAEAEPAAAGSASADQAADATERDASAGKGLSPLPGAVREGGARW